MFPIPVFLLSIRRKPPERDLLPLHPQPKNETIMFSIILTLVAGGILGYLLRRASFVRQLEKSTALTVCLLLFVLGLSIGSNRLIIDNLGRFGWQAALLAVAGTAGSIAAASLALRLYTKNRKEEKK